MANKHHSNRNRDDFVKRKANITEVGAVNAPTENLEWQAEELEVHSDPIKDSGTGHPVILRTFEYNINPQAPKNISKQMIFDSHKEQLKVMLWADGLVPMDEIKPPKVQISKNQNKYRIFVLCTPRETLLDKPIILK